MRIRVLGSAAGGGFPQWNCNCANCRGIRAGTIRARKRTQSSIAVSTDPDRWMLCNVSPDIHQQIAAHPALEPRSGVRDSCISAILLVDGQIDHSLGLLLLREHRRPLEVWTTEPVKEDLSTGLPILTVLGSYCGIQWNRIATDDSEFTIASLPGVCIQAMPVDGKPGPYSPHRRHPRSGDNIGLVFRIQTTGRQVFYAPGLGAITPAVQQAMQSSNVVMVDGTFWSDDEMVRAGVSTKRARDIGHLPQSGPGGMIEELSRLPRSTRRILIHINNTNPILDEAGPERAQLEAAGIEVAFDGMDIEL